MRGTPAASARLSRLARTALAVLGALLSWTGSARAGDREDVTGRARIHVIDLEGVIDRALSAYAKRSLAAATEEGADAVVLRIHSPGGEVGASLEIADAVLALPPTIHAVAFVGKEALSGATLVALACDELVMGRDAAIGDCQPILETGGGFVKAGEKIETFLRAKVRMMSAANGWPSLLAEKMVSEALEVIEVRRIGDVRAILVDGGEFASARDEDLVAGVRKSDLTRTGVVLEKGRVLTLGSLEARDLGFLKRPHLMTEEDLLAVLGGPGTKVVRVEMTTSERIGRFLLGFVGILAGIVILCVILSLFQGVGTATLVGSAALVLLVLVSATADLANGFPWLLVALGAVLLGIEVFLLPGFGVAGVLGLVAMSAGFLFLVTGVSLSDSGTLSFATARDFLVQMLLAMGVAGAVFLLLARFFPTLPLANRRLVLSGSGLAPGAATLPGDVVPVTGEVGRATTDLRPSGRVALARGVVDAGSEGGFVEAGTEVRVVRVEGARAIVRPEPPGAATS